MAFDRGDSQTGVTSLALLPIENGGTNASTALTAFSNLSEGNVVVTPSGNVGIGTSSPSAPLDVNGNLAITGSARRITGDFSNATVANRVMFQTSTVNGSTVVSAIPNGTSQLSQFVAYNNSDLSGVFQTAQLVSLGTEASFRAGISSGATYLPMTFYTGGSEKVRIDTSGNVGIGTSSPQGRLQINVQDGFIFNAASSISTMRFGSALTSEATAELAFSRGDGSIRISQGATGSALNERMRIDNAGNVGIGTSSPVRPLHISDVMRLQPRNGAPSSPGAGDIYFDSADNKLKCYDGSTWQNLF
jgi:hypothetical protein